MHERSFLCAFEKEEPEKVVGVDRVVYEAGVLLLLANHIHQTRDVRPNIALDIGKHGLRGLLVDLIFTHLRLI